MFRCVRSGFKDLVGTVLSASSMNLSHADEFLVAINALLVIPIAFRISIAEFPSAMLPIRRHFGDPAGDFCCPLLLDARLLVTHNSEPHYLGASCLIYRVKNICPNASSQTCVSINAVPVRASLCK